MRHCIVGKSKGVPLDLTGNVLLVGGSFTGKLKAFKRDTFEEMTVPSSFIPSMGVSISNGIRAIDYTDTDVYLGGDAMDGQSVAFIRVSRSTNSRISYLANRPSGNVVCFAHDNNYLYAGGDTTGSQFCRLPFPNLDTYTAFNISQRRPRSIAVDDNYVVVGSTIYSTYGLTVIKKSDWSQTAYAGGPHNAALLDGGLLFLTSGLVYNVATMTTVSGYPTISGTVYSIINDANYIYYMLQNSIQIVNKTTKNIDYTKTAATSYTNSLTQDANYIYYPVGNDLYRLSKSNLGGTPEKILTVPSTLYTIKAI